MLYYNCCEGGYAITNYKADSQIKVIATRETGDVKQYIKSPCLPFYIQGVFQRLCYGYKSENANKPQRSHPLTPSLNCLATGKPATYRAT